MKFGVTVVPRISDWKLFVDLESMGYDKKDFDRIQAVK